MPDIMSLDEFRATRTEVEDIGAHFGFDDGGGIRAAYVYADCCYIEKHSGTGGQYYLLIERSDWLSDDLPDLEQKLYDGWYVHEGKEYANG